MGRWSPRPLHCLLAQRRGYRRKNHQRPHLHTRLHGHAGGKKELITELKLDGLSLIPIAKNLNATIHTRLFSRRAAAGSVRAKQWKLIRVRELDNSYRYLLFDLSKDIGETNDLAGKSLERVKELATMIKKWESPLMAPAWLEGDIWEKNQRLKHNTNVIGRAAERKLP